MKRRDSGKRKNIEEECGGSRDSAEKKSKGEAAIDLNNLVSVEPAEQACREK